MKWLQWIISLTKDDYLVEGRLAHQYTDLEARQQIVQRYNAIYKPSVTPATHPEQFDPLQPPAGWAWDPYYECWLEHNDSR